MRKVNYVIKSPKNVYIRLNQQGAAVTCAEHDKTLFEESKAKNVLKSLPKTLKKLNFDVVAVPDMIKSSETSVIESSNYIVPDSISQWLEKFGICDDILKEAQKRKDELILELSNIDKQFSNMIHEIEFEGCVDLYGGWKERNKIKENRKRRRNIKDELIVISNVLRMDFRNLDRDILNKVVTGLAKRKFTYRMVEEEEENAM